MAGEGFEPSKAEPGDLQSAPIGRSGNPPGWSSGPFFIRMAWHSAGTYGTDPAAWKTAFTKAYPKNNPGTFVDGSGFDAAVLACLAGISAGSMTSRDLAKGLRNVGGVNGGAAYSWNQLTAAVKDVAAGKPVTYNGVWGYTKFDKAGDPSGGAFEVWSINDGVISKDPTQDIKF